MSILPILSICRIAMSAVAVMLGVEAAAADDAPLPPNNLPCDAFVKKNDGMWIAKHSVPADVGNAKNLIISPGEISPMTAMVGGVDLYVLLEAKCGKSPA
jgi:hypothetical protein